MVRSWSRTLGAVAAGAAVMLVLFLLTVFAEDRPLWGINPDVQLWLAGLVAAVVGVLAYAGLEARSPRTLGIGAGLGVAGFLVMVVGAMAVVASFPGPYASYEGWTVTTTFEEDWNASLAREALEAQGFNVTRIDEGALDARRGEDTFVFLDRPRTGPDGARDGFRLVVQFNHDGENVGDYAEARAQAEAERPALEADYQALLSGFEEATGWDHDTEPTWEAGIAVS